MVNNLTKWIKAKPVPSQVAEPAIKFLSSIMHRYGMPHCIITDNKKNFTSKKFKDYCVARRIKLDFASVVHP